ncbi:S8 family serine peptidase [Nocardia sp. NPDC049149]|uniref:S8 family serine peptidase n=1 Tax=Nocardia sp. NPDC049149 TaxID=3364315 RepID=UPI0037102BFB
MSSEYYAPGKVVVELTADANSIVSEYITDTVEAGAYTAFGIEVVDGALSWLSVESITRLYAAVEPYDVDPDLLASMLATYVIRFPEDTDVDGVVSELMALAEVVNAEPVGLCELAVTTANDPRLVDQWGLDAIKAPLAWDRQKGTDNIKVTVIDTGCDSNHPDLAPRLGTSLRGKGWDFCENPTCYGGERRVGDYTSPDDDPQDENGHGTGMAGIIGAATDNGIGIAGVTWGCRLFAARVACRTELPGGGVGAACNSDEMAKAIQWAGEWSHVANISMVNLYGDNKHVRDAVNYALQAKTTVVAAMGNDNSNILRYPAAYPGVIAVGAINKLGYQWVAGPSKGSNTGNHMSVSAPGSKIATLDLYSTWGSPQYTEATGTSPAAAFVSGVVALLYSCNVGITPRQVKQILEETASHVVPDPWTWPNSVYGNGIVDAKAAVDRVLDGPMPPP